MTPQTFDDQLDTQESNLGNTAFTAGSAGTGNAAHSLAAPYSHITVRIAFWQILSPQRLQAAQRHKL